MKDYYDILGVDEEATEEEIRARWTALRKKYQNDLEKTEEEDEWIKEINEAYEVLGNKSTRSEYDVKWTLQRSDAKRILEWEEKKFSKKKIFIPIGVLVFSLIVIWVIFRESQVPRAPKPKDFYEIKKFLEKKTAPQIPSAKNESKVKAEKKMPEEVREEAPRERTKTASIPLPPPSAAERESKRKEEPPEKILRRSEMPGVERETPKEMGKGMPRESTRIVSAPPPSPFVLEKESKPKEEPAPPVVSRSEAPVKVEKEVLKEVPKEIPKEVPKEALKEAPRESPKEVPKEIPKETPKEVPKELPKEVTGVTLRPGEKLPETVVALAPSPYVAKEEEVRQFFSNYVDRYNRKDINGFLSFFSSKAVQNQRDGIEKIREIYSKFFGQSQELRYQLEGMRFQIFQNFVEARARFRVAQKLKGQGEEKFWMGNIHWVLIKEDGNLKISSLDYQNEKSP